MFREDMTMRSIGRLLPIALLLAAACSQGKLGDIAPGVTAPAFRLHSPQGDAVALDDLTRQGPVLLNFWATWCEPCKQEVPALNEVYRKYKPLGVTLVAISVEDPPAAVAAFARRHKVEYPMLLDADGTVARRYGLIGVPMNVVVNRRGVVSIRKFGALDAEVRSALDAVQSASTR
jgi:peroxiredoxin